MYASESEAARGAEGGVGAGQQFGLASWSFMGLLGAQ